MDSKNSSYSYPLDIPYHYYELIANSFLSKTDRNNPKEYFIQQYNKRDDVLTNKSHFILKCIEYLDHIILTFEEIVQLKDDSDITYKDILSYIKTRSSYKIFDPPLKPLFAVESVDELFFCFHTHLNNVIKYQDLQFVLKNLNSLLKTLNDPKSPKSNNKKDKNKSLLKDGINKKIIEAKKIAEPLGGVYKNNQLLDDSEMIILNKFIKQIIKKGYFKKPDEFKTFHKISISMDFIRKTIHLVYLDNDKKNKNVFVELVHLFENFNNTTISTTKQKFSQFNGNYDLLKESITI